MTKLRARIFHDGSIEPPTSIIVSPEDGTPVEILDGTVTDDYGNEVELTGIAPTRESNKLRAFFGLD